MWKALASLCAAVLFGGWVHGVYTWNGGLVQLNLAFCTVIDGSFEFKDATLCSVPWKYQDGTLAGFNVQPVSLNSNGYPTSFDGGATILNTGMSIPPQSEFAGNYVLDYVGNFSITPSSGLFVSVSGAGCSHSGTTITGPNCTAVFSSVGGTNVILRMSAMSVAPTSIRFYPVKYASAALGGDGSMDLCTQGRNTGNIGLLQNCFSEQFIKVIADGPFGYLRHLDSGGYNQLAISKWEENTPLTWNSFGTPYIPATASVTSNNFTSDGGALYHVDLPGFSLTDKAVAIFKFPSTITPPSYVVASSVTNTNTITFTADPADVVVGMQAGNSNNELSFYSDGTYNRVTAVDHVAFTVTFSCGPFVTNCIGSGSLGISAGNRVYFSPMVNINSTGYKPLLHVHCVVYGNQFAAGPNANNTIPGGAANYMTVTYDAGLDTFINDADGNENNQAGLGAQWAPEMIAALANKTRTRPWIPWPRYAADISNNIASTYATKQATFYKNALNPVVGPIFEPPNENWNTGSRGTFPSTWYFYAKNTLQSSVYADNNDYYGSFVATAGPAISAVYGGDRSKYDLYVGFQGAVPPVKGGGGPDKKLQSPTYVANNCPGTPTTCVAYNWVTQVGYAGYWGNAYINSEYMYGYGYVYANGSAAQQTAALDAYINGGSTPQISANPTGSIQSRVTSFLSYKTAYAGSGINFGLMQYEGSYDSGTPQGAPISLSDKTESVLSVATGATTTLTIKPSWQGYVTTDGTTATLHVTTGPSPGSIALSMPLLCSGCVAGQMIECTGTCTTTWPLLYNQANAGSAGTPIAMTADNGWNYIYNTVGLSGLTTVIAGVCTELNGTQTILSATATTITVNAATDAGCVYGGSGGTASLVGSQTYLPALQTATQHSPTLVQYELASLKTYYDAGGRVPSHFEISNPNSGATEWSDFLPDIFASYSASPKFQAVQQFNASP